MEELDAGGRLQRVKARRLVCQWLRERQWQELVTVSVRGRVVTLKSNSATVRHELSYNIASLEEWLQEWLGEGWRVRLR